MSVVILGNGLDTQKSKHPKIKFWLTFKGNKTFLMENDLLDKLSPPGKGPVHIKTL